MESPRVKNAPLRAYFCFPYYVIVYCTLRHKLLNCGAKNLVQNESIDSITIDDDNIFVELNKHSNRKKAVKGAPHALRSRSRSGTPLSQPAGYLKSTVSRNLKHMHTLTNDTRSPSVRHRRKSNKQRQKSPPLFKRPASELLFENP